MKDQKKNCPKTNPLGLVNPKTSPMQKAMACVSAYHRVDEYSDVNGSYTGYPLDGSEKPVQDADDL